MSSLIRKIPITLKRSGGRGGAPFVLGGFIYFPLIISLSLLYSVSCTVVNSNEQTFSVCLAFCNIEGFSLQGENLRFQYSVLGLLFSTVSQSLFWHPLTETHTTCFTYLLLSLVTSYVSSPVISCSVNRAWIVKISVLAGGSFWDCVEVIEVLGAKKVESVSCWL